MKKSILVFFFLLLISHTVLSQIESHYPKYDSLSKTYKIANIKEIKKAYLISVIDRDNYKFTIVSPKIKDKEKGKEKIQIGEEYDLLFYSIYPTPGENTILVGGNPIFHDFRINGVRIKFQGNFDTGILVTTPDLRGLYYNRPNK